ncbi:TonB-dependent receptor [Rhodobacter sp. SGA-6-6]|uniref:TonB-dependent receptor domain-containing protein n=1 Tax=Rhodobacter sp. SGA-6-6 TaxID=2710882 RepID=UPI0013EBA2AD|nr:TonB-dependent receptor [Rhodobacter sp. SGA-6-6]NGM44538.1 TonB-dependent receptor [Rhodobacter sp. SGA-6-6]
MTTKRIASTTAMALCLAALALPVAAQDAAAGADALYLGRIIIGYTDDGTPVYAGDNTSVIEGDALTGQGGMTTIDDVVRQTPGVTTLLNAGQPGVAVAIRGMGGSRVETTIEGVPQNFRFTAHNTADGFAYVDPFLLSSISVTRGAGVTSAGMAGSVNFSLLSATDLVDGEGTGGLVRLRYGDNGEGFGGVIAAGLSKGPLDLAFALSRRNFDAYVNGAGEEVNETMQDGGSAMLRGAYRVSDALSFSFLALKSDFAYDSAYRMSFGPGLPPTTLAYYNHEVSNEIYSLGVTYSDGDLINLSANLYSGTTSHLHRPDSPSGSARGRLMETETIGFNLQNVSTLALGDWALTSTNGFEISRDKLGGQQNSAGTIPGTNPVRGHSDRKAIFSENVFENGPFEVMLGFRYSDYELSGDLAGTTYDIDHNSFDPKVTLAYRINDTFQPYVSVYRTTRSPTLQEAFLGGGDPSAGHGGFVGNPALLPEVSEGYEIGVNITRDGVFRPGDSVKGRINVYDLDVDNFIIAQSGVGGVGMQFVNVPEKVNTKGLELELGYESEVFSAILAWAHTDAKYGLGRLQPKNSVSATLAGHFLGGDLTVGTTLVYNSNGPASIAFETDANRGSYKTIDLFASYDVTDNFRIDAKIANITDELYTPWAATDNSGAGRSAYIGAELRF